MLRGFAAGSLLGSSALYAQPGGAQPAQQAAGAAAPGALGARPKVFVEEISLECRQMLQAWEKYSQGVNDLHGEFERYVYDSTFLVEKRAIGEIWYEQPDKGRIDLRPSPRLPEVNQNGQRLNPGKVGANGQPFTVQPDNTSKWICQGDALLAIDVEQKTYVIGEIPPHMQGKNIVKSPLPFIFGVSAAELEKRYYLSLGSKHAPRGNAEAKLAPTIHIVAAPKLAEDAKEWSRAEILLDPGTTFRDANNQPLIVPRALKLLDPTQQQETTYVFFLDRTKVNERRWFGDPFKEPGLLSGYKCTERFRVACPEDETKRTVEQQPAVGTVQNR
jgi:TIGR03009 family protein